MAKNKVSEWSSTPANNTDIGGVNIAEGCAPSGINNAIRELMAQVKDMQAGSDADNFVVGGNLSVTGTSAFTGVATFTAAPVFPTGFGIVPSGGIIMWSGSVATIPSGWYLCNGSNGTPDLRDKFIIGARQDDSGTAKTNITGSLTQTGGSKDAIVVSHSHTATDSGHTHTLSNPRQAQGGAVGGFSNTPTAAPAGGTVATTDSGTANITVSTTGSSGTNANLVPYYALAFIQKA